MDALTFLREWKRMCDTFENCCMCPVGDCSGCLGNATTKARIYLLETIEKWAAENPQKTILQDFLDKYPDAPMDEHGMPLEVCPVDLGISDAKLCEESSLDACVKCWCRSLDEAKEAEK